MNVYVLMGHHYNESWLVGLFASKKDAWREVLRIRWNECERTLEDCRLLGKRERFDDGSLGAWWSDMYRKDKRYFTVTSSSLQGSLK